MMRSTDTWHGRSYFIAVRAVAASIPSGPHAYSITARRGRARGEPAIERRDDAAALADAAVLGRQHELDVELAEEIEIEQLRAAAGAVEQRRRRRRARAAPAPASRTARGRRRRRPSTPRWADRRP